MGEPDCFTHGNIAIAWVQELGVVAGWRPRGHAATCSKFVLQADLVLEAISFSPVLAASTACFLHLCSNQETQIPSIPYFVHSSDMFVAPWIPWPKDLARSSRAHVFTTHVSTLPTSPLPKLSTWPTSTQGSCNTMSQIVPACRKTIDRDLYTN